MDPGPWHLLHRARPFTPNEDRNAQHWGRRASLTKHWREAFAALAREAEIPRCDRIMVAAIHERRNRASMPDIGGCYPTVKAAIDGLVDAGVIPDDGPAYLTRLIFLAPQVSGRDGLRLVVSRA